jgi:hypothetical protein
MERIATAVLSAMQSGSLNKLPTAEIVPITRDDKLPALVDLETDRSIPDRVLMWMGSNGVAEMRRPLDTAERTALQRRAIDLQSALAPWPPSSRDELEGEVSLMLNVPANRGLDETAAMGFVAQYLQLTRARPHWAIVKVCRMVRLGKAGLPPAYCPTEAEFNLLIDREVAYYERALAKAQRVLDAKVQPPDPPKPTHAEMEARFRPPAEASPSIEAQSCPPSIATDGNHAARVMADIAARKAEREKLTNAMDD